MFIFREDFTAAGCAILDHLQIGGLVVTKILEFRKSQNFVDFSENFKKISSATTNDGHPDRTTHLPRDPRIVNDLFISGKSSESVTTVANALHDPDGRHFALKLSPKFEKCNLQAHLGPGEAKSAFSKFSSSKIKFWGCFEFFHHPALPPC